ncbi:MAG: hypothetical protein LBM69_07020 [Lachnospiraceae bacterium]|jgi:hypothetical protein|nr:hypothetical protein [Lachnospiraceae bacterium]
MGRQYNQDREDDHIKGALQEALSTGDFHRLNDLVTKSAQNILDGVGSTAKAKVKATVDGVAPHIHKTIHDVKNRSASSYANYANFIRKPKEKFHKYSQSRSSKVEHPKAQVVKPIVVAYRPPFPYRRVGEVSGVLLIVLGGIFSAFLVTYLIGFLFSGSIARLGLVSVIRAYLGLMGLGVSGGSILAGIVISKRLSRAERYVKLLNGKTYMNLEDLSEQFGAKVRYLRRDLHNMVRAGFFPEGHFDAHKTCFMTTDATYTQYIAIDKERKRLEAEKQLSLAAKETKQTQQAITPQTKVSSQTQKLLEEGQRYIESLHRANDHIPGEIVSDKLANLEKLLIMIFERIRQHEQQAVKMQKFMDYYLPTTLKLVQAYEDFDKVSVAGEDIISAKQQIESALDTINQAFRELLNGLYQDAVFDATTDAQVLQTMLAREGLTGEFPKTKE